MRSYLGTSNINNIAPWVHGAFTFNSRDYATTLSTYGLKDEGIVALKHD